MPDQATIPNVAGEIAGEIAQGGALGVHDVARRVRTDPRTILRWIMRGLPDGLGGRIRLEAVKRGKKWLTTEAALARFHAAMPSNAVRPGEETAAPRPLRLASQSRQDYAAATERLRQRGIY